MAKQIQYAYLHQAYPPKDPEPKPFAQAHRPQGPMVAVRTAVAAPPPSKRLTLEGFPHLLCPVLRENVRGENARRKRGENGRKRGDEVEKCVSRL